MIKNVILDMGNVLLSYEPESYAGILSSKKAAPFILKELYLGEDWPKQDLGLVGKEELYELVKPRVPEEYHEDLRKNVYGWSDLMRPIPGAADFLKEMKAEGYRLFVLSNAGVDFHEYFPRHYDVSLFDGLVVSCDLHITKPDRRIYESLLESYGLKAEECIFADDLPRNVAGAETLGIHGFLFRGDYRELLEEIDRINC